MSTDVMFYQSLHLLRGDLATVREEVMHELGSGTNIINLTNVGRLICDKGV
jgi:hypothetical protein